MIVDSDLMVGVLVQVQNLTFTTQKYQHMLDFLKKYLHWHSILVFVILVKH